MKSISGIILLLVSFFLLGAGAAAAPIIANHTTTHLSDVPLSAINAAKEDLHIAYGHTSHGSQILTGMDGLTTFANAPYGGSTYAWNTGGTGGALDLRDELGDYEMPYGAADLGNPDYTAWASATRSYLQTHPDVNVILWSWCGQAATTSANIDTYLSLMNQLETDYPRVKFVYMTGHLDGTGSGGILNLRNEQIRAYARAHNKTLYDFADIESYDPDGLVNYMNLYANDNCDYNGRNWATEWQNSHMQGTDWYSCDAAHTQPLNANQKAYAAWWLWARLAGWDGTPAGSYQTPDTNESIGIYQKGTGTFFMRNSNSGGAADNISQFTSGSNAALVPLVGDWNGDGTDTIGFYQQSNGTFLLKNSNSGGAVDLVFRFGWGTSNGDLLPLAGDWNGDGTDTVGFYQKSTGIFFLKNSNSGGAADNIFQYGAGGNDWAPIVGDWDNSGTDTVGLYQTSIGAFFLKNTNGPGNADTTFQYGAGGNDWIHLAGDWNGDGYATVGAYQKSIGVFFLKNSNTYGAADTVFQFGPGSSSGDVVPLAGRWV